MEDFLASISIFAFGFAPKGYALCDGQLLPINQNQALFSLLGTTYGGNGQTTFALPDFRGKTPVHVGLGLVQGNVGGEEFHTIALGELPQHAHAVGSGVVKANAGATADSKIPDGNYYGSNPTLTNRFSNRTDAGMYNNTPFDTGTNVSSSQGHENRMPYLVLNFAIALTGIFPSRS